MLLNQSPTSEERDEIEEIDHIDLCKSISLCQKQNNLLNVCFQGAFFQTWKFFFANCSDLVRTNEQPRTETKCK